MALTLLDPSGGSAAKTGRAAAAVLFGRVLGGVVSGLVVETASIAWVAYVAGVVNLAAALLVFALLPRSTPEAQALLDVATESESGEGQAEGEKADAPLLSLPALPDEEDDGRVWQWGGPLVDAVVGTWGGWGHLATLLINGLVCGTFNTFVPASLKDRFGVRPFVVPLVVAAQTAVRSGAAAWGVPALATRLREPALSAVLAVGLAVALVLVWGVSAWLPGLVVSATLAVCLQSMHNAAALACASAFIESEHRAVRGVVKGASFAVYVGGIAIGAFVAFLLWSSAFHNVALFLPLAALALLCTLLHRGAPVSVAVRRLPPAPVLAQAPSPLAQADVYSPPPHAQGDATMQRAATASSAGGDESDRESDAADDDVLLGGAREASPAPLVTLATDALEDEL
jgi:hypothetical protein